MNKAGWISAASAAVIGLSGCGRQPQQGAMGGPGGMPPPRVKVMETRLEEANPITEYIAHVEPIQEVQLKAQVEGTIEAVNFREGGRVKEGDLLFTIDAAPYEASLAEKEAELAQAQANLNRAEKFIAMLNAADNRSVSKSDLDTAEANVAEGQALVHRAKAAVRQAEIDLGYTQITSPIDGRIGRALITKGNVVSPSSGVLATVIQVDPIRVVFAMPDAEYLTAFDRYSSDSNYQAEVKVRLANGQVLSDEGEIDFDDNQMNPATGTIDIHMRFPNPRRMLVPNNFVTVLTREGRASEKVLVPAEAVMHDSEGAFVWTVSDDHTAEQVRVETGEVIGTRQIIESGLESGRRVVIAGMQKIRAAGMPVSPVEPASAE